MPPTPPAVEIRDHVAGNRQPDTAGGDVDVRTAPDSLEIVTDLLPSDDQVHTIHAGGLNTWSIVLLITTLPP